MDNLWKSLWKNKGDDCIKVEKKEEVFYFSTTTEGFSTKKSTVIGDFVGVKSRL